MFELYMIAWRVIGTHRSGREHGTCNFKSAVNRCKLANLSAKETYEFYPVRKRFFFFGTYKRVKGY